MVRRILLSALTALTLGSPALAEPYQGFPGNQWAPRDDRDDRDRDRDQRDAREVPLSSILRDLRMQHGGQHLDAQKVGDRYRISWITEDGRRLTIEVDAATGRTLSVRG